MPLSPKGVGLLGSPRSVKVGQSPAEVVYREGKVKLLHYLPQASQRYPVPLLMVYALVNRPSILDLLPGRSVVEHFLKSGFEVYLIDWGFPDQADRWNSLADYITGSLHRCVEAVKGFAASPQVSLLGYCQGGTFAVIFTALYPDQVKNLILMAAPVDFRVEGGLLNVWSKREYFDVDKLVDTFGNIPAWTLNSAFAGLRPVYYTFDKYVRFGWSLAEGKADDVSVEQFLAIDKWLAEGIPHPGEVFREFVRSCYQDNRLIQNRLLVGSRVVDLRQITCSVCTLIAEKDHIIPPRSSQALMEAISSQDTGSLSFPGGHIEMVVGPRAGVEFWPRAVQWLQARSQ